MTNQQIEKLAEAIVQTGDYDAALALLEKITQAARAAAVQDVMIDLADFGQTEAVEIIRENY